MPFEIQSETDIANMASHSNFSKAANGATRPAVLNVGDLLALVVRSPSMLVDALIPAAGATLMFGAPKSNKTLLAVQIGIAVASGHALCDQYRVVESGAVLMLEQDDPAGPASVQGILKCSQVPVEGIPFHLVARVPFTFGLQFIEWLECEIVERSIRLVILDSYTALRGSRGSGVDIVKAEQQDLTSIDELAKRTNSAILIIHHSSKGSAGLNWSDQAAGTFAMSAATEAQVHISRFADLDSNAAERLVRVRGRHLEGTEVVLRFRKETLDHEFLLEGGAAAFYPLILQIQAAFGTSTFSPKDLSQETGVSRATAHRQIERVYRSGALVKRGYGEYVLAGLRP